MSRILYDNQWFNPISPGTYYEKQFQEIVLSHAPSLFPEFHTVPFSPIVASDEDTARPDLALIDRLYRTWWVVEVELINHSLEGHVLPQIETLAKATYGSKEVALLTRNSSKLDGYRLADMVKGKQPRVLVVANAFDPKWEVKLARFGVEYVAIQILHSKQNEQMYQVFGRVQAFPPEVVSECHLDRLMPRLLRVDSPAGLSIKRGEALAIEFEGGLTSWIRLDTSDGVWLNPTADHPLQLRVRYLLLRADDGKLILVRKD